jgi:hypothetical protein
MDNDRGDQRLDLSPLGHDRDPAAYERAIEAILIRTQPELARRRAMTTPIGQVAQWWRPMLALAATLIVVAVGVLTQVAPAATTTEGSTPGFGQWLGIPTPVSGWLETNQSPSPAQVFAAFQEDR